MPRIFISVLSFALSQTAVASDLTDAGFILQASTGYGYGAPSVVAVEDEELGYSYTMYVESQQSAGNWAIFRATSTDGVSFTLGTSAVITADSTQFYTRSVAQPAALFDGTTWHMFLSGTGNTASDKGIAYLISTDGITWTFDSKVASLGTAGGGDASVTLVDDVMYLYFTRGTRIYGMQSTDFGDTWGAEALIMAPTASTSWMSRAVNGSAAFCDEFGTAPDAIMLPFYGWNASNTKAFASASSADGVTMTIDPYAPYTYSTGAALDYLHWDVLNTDTGYVVYYSKVDSNGRKAIGLATQATTVGWSEASDRVCE
jgi:hypothetical protein